MKSKRNVRKRERVPRLSGGRRFKMFSASLQLRRAVLINAQEHPVVFSPACVVLQLYGRSVAPPVVTFMI